MCVSLCVSLCVCVCVTLCVCVCLVWDPCQHVDDRAMSTSCWFNLDLLVFRVISETNLVRTFVIHGHVVVQISLGTPSAWHKCQKQPKCPKVLQKSARRVLVSLGREVQKGLSHHARETA